MSRADDMTLGNRLLLAYRRWRHTKGYGVHSPFAYRLVRLALHPSRRYGYYGYETIENTIRVGENLGHVKRKDARLLLRLAVTARAERVVAESMPPVWLEAAVEAAGIPLVLVPEAGKPGLDDLVLLRGNANRQTAARWLAEGAMVVAFDPGDLLRAEIVSPKEFGLLFDGKRVLIASGRREMQFVKYDMKF